MDITEIRLQAFLKREAEKALQERLWTAREGFYVMTERTGEELFGPYTRSEADAVCRFAAKAFGGPARIVKGYGLPEGGL